MLKIIGSIMILAATTAMGFGKMEALTGRVRALEGFLTAFDRLSAETSCRLTPLPQLFDGLAKSAPSPADGFFASCLRLGGDLTETALAPVWNRALREVKYLLPDDRRALSAAGEILGRYDDDGQRKSLEAVILQVKSRLEDAKARRGSQGKMCATLGVAAGLGLVILFI